MVLRQEDPPADIIARYPKHIDHKHDEKHNLKTKARQQLGAKYRSTYQS